MNLNMVLSLPIRKWNIFGIATCLQFTSYSGVDSSPQPFTVGLKRNEAEANRERLESTPK